MIAASIAVAALVISPEMAYASDNTQDNQPTKTCQNGGWCPNPERGSATSTIGGGNRAIELPDGASFEYTLSQDRTILFTGSALV